VAGESQSDRMPHRVDVPHAQVAPQVATWGLRVNDTVVGVVQIDLRGLCRSATP
jgi:hypothetical protein